jgi:hypothetical protein
VQKQIFHDSNLYDFLFFVKKNVSTKTSNKMTNEMILRKISLTYQKLLDHLSLHQLNLHVIENLDQVQHLYHDIHNGMMNRRDVDFAHDCLFYHIQNITKNQ